MSTLQKTFSIPRDFPDWLSPIVVKEIRQGLRGYFFVGGFMLLHVVLVLWAFFFGIAVETSGSGADTVFWIILVIGLFVLSVRMQGGVRGEQKANTLELLQLTRQTPWRIAAGKWCANMVLALLFITSLLPYGMLRYFVGSFNLLFDAVTLVILFCATGVFSALFLFSSSLPRVIGIAVNVVLGIFAYLVVTFIVTFLFGGGARFFGISFSGASKTPEFFAVLGATVGFCILYTLLFLFMTSGRVALGTDQIAFRKRLLGWALVTPAIVAAIFDAKIEIVGALLVASSPVALVMLDAILTPTSASVPAFAAFGRRKFLGRIGALFFSPSQGAGIVYCAVTALVIFGAFLLLKNDADNAPVILLATINSIFLPLAVARLFSKIFRKVSLVVRYFVFYAVQWLFFAVCVGAGNVLTFPGSKLVMSLVPTGVMVTATETSWLIPTLVTVTHSLFIFAVLFGFLRRDFSAVRKMLRGERVDALPSL